MSKKGIKQTKEHIEKRMLSRTITMKDRDINGENNNHWKGGAVLKVKRYKQKYPEVEKFNGIKARSKILNIPHTFNLLEFRQWFNNAEKKCVYCDLDVSTKTKKRMDNLSIDRKYNEVGYTIDNICIACCRCNTVKGNTFTYDEMREVAQKYIKTKRETITSV